jgi:hypothetical protein
MTSHPDDSGFLQPDDWFGDWGGYGVYAWTGWYSPGSQRGRMDRNFLHVDGSVQGMNVGAFDSALRAVPAQNWASGAYGQGYLPPG